MYKHLLHPLWQISVEEGGSIGLESVGQSVLQMMPHWLRLAPWELHPEFVPECPDVGCNTLLVGLIQYEHVHTITRARSDQTAQLFTT